LRSGDRFLVGCDVPGSSGAGGTMVVTEDSPAILSHNDQERA
jgi:hypothetical protein